MPYEFQIKPGVWEANPGISENLVDETPPKNRFPKARSMLSLPVGERWGNTMKDFSDRLAVCTAPRQSDNPAGIVRQTRGLRPLGPSVFWPESRIHEFSRDLADSTEDGTFRHGKSASQDDGRSTKQHVTEGKDLEPAHRGYRRASLVGINLGSLGKGQRIWSSGTVQLFNAGSMMVTWYSKSINRPSTITLETETS